MSSISEAIKAARNGQAALEEANHRPQFYRSCRESSSFCLSKNDLRSCTFVRSSHFAFCSFGGSPELTHNENPSGVELGLGFRKVLDGFWYRDNLQPSDCAAWVGFLPLEYLVVPLSILATMSGFLYIDWIKEPASNTMIFSSLRLKGQGSRLGVYAALVGVGSSLSSLDSGFAFFTSVSQPRFLWLQRCSVLLWS
jgi:hypothetical protein